ncbi:MAG: hypothetical protein B5M53_10285, partial [Candidatus Cloacimonas sp. 4484_209]
MLLVAYFEYIISQILPLHLRKRVLTKVYKSIKYNPFSHAMRLRAKVVRNLFIHFGEGSFIKEGVEIKGFEKISIGRECSINQNCFFSVSGGLTVGNFVRIAHDCAFHTGSHNYLDITKPITKQGLTHKEIIIEDDVWIGCHCIILQGITIGKGS